MVMHAADADTQSDQNEEAQLGDSDLTQEDHPCTSSPQDAVSGGGSGAEHQCQASSSMQTLHHPGAALPSQSSHHQQPCEREAISPCGTAPHGVSESIPASDPRQNKGLADSQAIQIEDESMDDLLEFLADAAAADELQLPAADITAQPISNHNSCSSSKHALQD